MNITRWFPLAIVAAAMLVIAGCGSDGAQGPPGADGAPGQDGQDGSVAFNTAVETCAGCHSSTGLLGPEDVHPITPTLLTGNDVNITQVLVGGSGEVTITITVDDTAGAGGTAVGGLGVISGNDIRFTLAYLDMGAGNPSSLPTSNAAKYDDGWKSIFFSTTSGNPTYQNVQAGGNFVESPTGTYTYTLWNTAGAANLDIQTTGGYNSGTPANSMIYRVGVQVLDNLAQDWFDFVPVVGGGAQSPAPVVRELTTTAECNVCHDADADNDGLSIHGTRRTVEYCVTCHNESILDQEFNFKVMVHRIHMGKELPSVDAGTTTTVAGETGFALGGFPQSVSNCQKCHSAGAQASYATSATASVPTRAACGSCHDDVVFATGAGHNPMPGTDDHDYGSPYNIVATADTGCGGCHNGGQALTLGDHHLRNAVLAEAATWTFNIVSATFNPADNKVTVDFTVSDGATQDLTTVPLPAAWNEAESSLRLYIGWRPEGNADYTNSGNGSTSTPASPIEKRIINCTGTPLVCSLGSGVTNIGGNVHRVAITLPSGDARSAGSGIVVMEGHPAVQIADPVLEMSAIPVKSDEFEFAIRDASFVPRRASVAIAKCQVCHNSVDIHGGRRVDNINVCTTCHNSANTDVARRTAGVLGVDGKYEESVDFKHMIHRIHKGRADGSAGITVYGFGGTSHAFKGEMPDGTPLNACLICHTNAAALNVPITNGLEGTTIDSNVVGNHSDDVNISPYLATCGGCHQSTRSTNHMQLQGGSFQVLEDNIVYW